MTSLDSHDQATVQCWPVQQFLLNRIQAIYYLRPLIHFDTNVGKLDATNWLDDLELGTFASASPWGKDSRSYTASFNASNATPTHRSAPMLLGIPCLLPHTMSGRIPPPTKVPVSRSNCAPPTFVTCRNDGVRYSATVSLNPPPSGNGKVCWIKPFPYVLLPTIATTLPLSCNADAKTSAADAVPSLTRSTMFFCARYCDRISGSRPS
mmetsp:Transcript_23823/g.66546  ORF Transcript_23823/g.66546 Transcript_23823/m.66546 type:complete len:208 (+) Transcript_23823:392-1015(+)